MRIPFIFKLIINRYFFEKIAALILLGLLLYALGSFLLIFLFTFLFAYLFLDLAKWLMVKVYQFVEQIQSERIKEALLWCNRPTIVITIIYIVFIIMITAMFYSLIPQLIEETK